MADVIFRKERAQTAGELLIALFLPVAMGGFLWLLNIPLSTIEAPGNSDFLRGLNAFLLGLGGLISLGIGVQALRSAGTTLRVGPGTLGWHSAGERVEVRCADVVELVWEPAVATTNPFFSRGWRVDRYTMRLAGGASLTLTCPFYDHEAVRRSLFAAIRRPLEEARQVLAADGSVDCGALRLTREGLLPEAPFPEETAPASGVQGGPPARAGVVPWQALSGLVFHVPWDLEDEATLKISARGGTIALPISRIRNPHVVLALADELGPPR